MLKIDIITIFPQLFTNITDFGVIKEGKAKKLCEVNVYNLRDFTIDKHKKVDDRPYGGGTGMVMAVQPIDDAVNFIKSKNKTVNKEFQKVILLSPQGETLKQKKLKFLSTMENIIIICGRYEGVDERVRLLVSDLEISIGDYILTGGEIPAMVIIDGVIRLLEGVVGKEQSIIHESFENNLLDFPQYTRPEIYKGIRVPEVLISGNHKEIEKWRKEKSLESTREKRPDLIDKNY
ncbi:MAG: tRNA (guanosine(37)-N1)-methyltransferase TrmD [Actinobacteria bacterium]|nr:tRNA (guanosine(37)-N1)-methyltransferase TrmD [Actinomycetota bacterium]